MKAETIDRARTFLALARTDLGDELGGLSPVDLLLDNMPELEGRQEAAELLELAERREAERRAREWEGDETTGGVKSRGWQERRRSDYRCQNCGATGTADVRGQPGFGEQIVVCAAKRGGCGRMDRRLPVERRAAVDRRGRPRAPAVVRQLGEALDAGLEMIDEWVELTKRAPNTAAAIEGVRGVRRRLGLMYSALETVLVSLEHGPVPELAELMDRLADDMGEAEGGTDDA